MEELRDALLEMDVEIERLSWGIQAADVLSEAFAGRHGHGEGLYAVCEYLREIHGKLRRDLDGCLEQVRTGREQPEDPIQGEKTGEKGGKPGYTLQSRPM